MGRSREWPLFTEWVGCSARCSLVGVKMEMPREVARGVKGSGL
jgi:hypothetical protein